MYCNKCGKVIVEGSLFCTWCGARVEIPAEAASENVDISRSEGMNAAVGENTNAGNTAAQEVKQPAAQESAQEIAGSTEKQKAAGNVPQQDEVSAGGADEQAGAAAADGSREQNGSAGSIPPENGKAPVGTETEVALNTAENEEKTRKYYTGVQLAVCLIVAGVMAAAAGVFAGLYFSVI